MNNLKEQIKKIYDFVNVEFDIENKEQIEGIKESLELEKIEMLDIMLKEYNKQVIKLKRAEQQRQAQKDYKKIGTNLKLEEYKKFEVIAEIDNLSISEFCRRALYSFIAPKTVSSEELEAKKELEGFKARYEALEAENKQIKEDKNTLEAKSEENEIKYNSLKAKNKNLNNALEVLNDKYKPLKRKEEDYERLTLLGRLVNIFKKQK